MVLWRTEKKFFNYHQILAVSVLYYLTLTKSVCLGFVVVQTNYQRVTLSPYVTERLKGHLCDGAIRIRIVY